MSAPKKTIRLGSRKSELALAQTREVQALLSKNSPEVEFVIETMETIGDKILDVSLQKIGEKNLFTKELEAALAAHQVDMVVHSLKDLPTTLPDGMTIGAILEREDPRDAAVFHPKYADVKDMALAKLPSGAVIGTSSLRRSAQLTSRYPHFQFEAVRGNINTRLRKLSEDSKYDAIILAVAGLKRLGLSQTIGQYLESNLSYHAVGQGALAVECRSEDSSIADLLKPLNHFPSVLMCTAERSLLRALQGGCSVPVGAASSFDSKTGTVTLTGAVFSLDGKRGVRHTSSEKIMDESSATERCEKLGVVVANQLFAQGARNILQQARQADSPSHDTE